MGAQSRHAEQRFAAAAMALMARHRREISPTLPASAARDLLLIARAIVEDGAQSAHTPPPDLQARIVRALLGYLVLR